MLFRLGWDIWLNIDPYIVRDVAAGWRVGFHALLPKAGCDSDCCKAFFLLARGALFAERRAW